MKRVGVWLFVDYKKQALRPLKDFPNNKVGLIKAKNYAAVLNKKMFKSEKGILGDKARGIVTQFYGIAVLEAQDQ